MAEEIEAVTPNNDAAEIPKAPSPFADGLPETPETPEVPETNDAEDKTLLGPEEKKDSPEAGDEPKKDEVKAEIPESYDIKLDEGMELDEATLDLFTPIFKELGISNDGAQKLVDAYVPLIQSSIDQNKAQASADFKEIVKGWKEDTVKQLGTEFKGDMAACGRALNKFGNTELREFMQETGVGNNKFMVAFMSKVGKTISEDTLVEGETPNLDANDPRKLYPSMPA